MRQATTVFTQVNIPAPGGEMLKNIFQPLIYGPSPHLGGRGSRDQLTIYC
jgi:hypothetical protein